MLAYNKKILNDLYVRDQADEALRSGCISADEHAFITERHQGVFYTPNVFIRIGLGMLALVVVLAIMVFCGVFINVNHPGPFLLFFGVVCYVGAELFVTTKAHYNSGVDNVLMWLGGLLMWLGSSYLLMKYCDYSYPFNSVSYNIAISIAALVICSALAIRFADTLASVVAFGALLCFTFYVYYRYAGVFAKYITPFLLMFICALVLWLCDRAAAAGRLVLYSSCLLWVRVAALIALCLAGNYYLVREISNELFNLNLRPQDTLPMGWFFWLWTSGVPVVYSYLGIRRRSIVLLRCAAPLAVVAILTFRHYHAVLSPEAAMLLGGTALFAGSYVLISYLRLPRGGFTFAPALHVNDVTAIYRQVVTEAIGDHAPSQSRRDSASSSATTW